ncbi:hypothetical protein Tco_0800906 [Tanacetum coccineum]|uniref:Uncharacterized protein n=1 Tax=Tanacetum coccineum TaxID=301880 RepID=A0ABQ4ZYW5_9ASTR
MPRDVYYKRRIIAITKLQIVEWHGYKHLDWITIHRDDDKLYTFKEGDFKRLRLQYICLVPQGQKASDYDNSNLVPLRQNVVPTAEKTDSS